VSGDPAIPAEGPLMVIANHPFGVVDGIILCWLVGRARADYKIMTHAILRQAPEVRDRIIPVDFTGTEEAQSRNLAARADAEAVRRQGGAVIAFPSGGGAAAHQRACRAPR